MSMLTVGTIKGPAGQPMIGLLTTRDMKRFVQADHRAQQRLMLSIMLRIMRTETVMTPSLPTRSMARAMRSPISFSPFAEIVPTWKRNIS